MGKRILPAIFFLLILVLAACQAEDAEPAPEQPMEETAEAVESPEERVAEFIELWKSGDFSGLHTNYLNQGTQSVYGEASFVTWQQELHEQLGIDNLEVTYTEPAEDAEWSQEQPADFPIQVAFDTIIGPVEFEKTLTLLYESHGEVEDWFVEWDPSFIVPNLEAGDQVSTDVTQGPRGEIVDRNGSAIASNSTGYEVRVIPENFDLSKKQQLAELLGMSEQAVDDKLNQSWVEPHYLVPIAQIKADQATLDELFTIRGTTHEEVAMRNYPYGRALSHISGYMGPITAEQLDAWSGQGYSTETMVGRQGLEEILQERLRGKAGGRIILKKQQENAIITSVDNEPLPGETVALTIDAELQQSLYGAMGEQAGTSAAIDPDTGETLALVSSPGFDPNEFIPNITNSRFQELTNDPLQPFFNRFAAIYAPGTVMQPVTAAIGLESGTLNPAEALDITGKSWQRYRSWGDYRITRPRDDVSNPIDLDKALIYSDSIYFAQQALNMPNDDFRIGLENFGFGEEIAFPIELTPSRISQDGTFGSEGQLAGTASGQGQMQVNILHMASLYSPILTNGKLYKPTLLLDDEDQQVWNENLIDAENAELLKISLSNAGKELGTELAGTSGTSRERGEQNGWFVGYSLMNPDLIVAMMVEGEEQVEGMVEQALSAREEE
ncbi:penicillin-binding transpeptidase domain-containing protein [Planococcus sp. ISL-110]|uniref:penicillin-binding transpeptidase domain-containing protein n=1 Tax=Planococcus sp. ISL-110 TaxID=2819167 RepID=UPI001BE77B43|nr:penicillin-binding transpeptidase domain-containing protein [Planococcus sp. ISL-110]MBT2569751.1 penicillin-binding transpeptidase domain-containing protein [Planococcus sp. ISL-110]